jgi:hypothetical protein
VIKIHSLETIGSGNIFRNLLITFELLWIEQETIESIIMNNIVNKEEIDDNIDSNYEGINDNIVNKEKGDDDNEYNINDNIDNNEEIDNND